MPKGRLNLNTISFALTLLHVSSCGNRIQVKRLEGTKERSKEQAAPIQPTGNVASKDAEVNSKIPGNASMQSSSPQSSGSKIEPVLQTPEAEKVTPVGASSSSSPTPPLPSGAMIPVVSSNPLLSRALTIEVEDYYAKFPRRAGECSKEIHNKFVVKGPDGKTYPTWHPARDPETGCAFGHEHGDDPKKSDMFPAIGMPPYGYTAELWSPNNPAEQRYQTHVGYKTQYANKMVSKEDGNSCNVQMTFHMDTSTADGITNKLHEYFYDLECTNGVKIHWKSLASLGTNGEYQGRCNGASAAIEKTTIPFQAASAPNSFLSGLGPRSIQSWDSCIRSVISGGDTQFWRLGDRWLFGAEVNNPSVTLSLLITIAPTSTGRYAKADAPNGFEYTIDMCKYPGMSETGSCKDIKAKGITFDDPRSPWTGEGRWTRPMWIFKFKNTSNTLKWYTDALGNNISKTPFPGSIEQYFSSTPNEFKGFDVPDLYTYKEPNSGVRLPN